MRELISVVHNLWVLVDEGHRDVAGVGLPSSEAPGVPEKVAEKVDAGQQVSFWEIMREGKPEPGGGTSRDAPGHPAADPVLEGSEGDL